MGAGAGKEAEEQQTSQPGNNGNSGKHNTPNEHVNANAAANSNNNNNNNNNSADGNPNKSSSAAVKVETQAQHSSPQHPTQQQQQQQPTINNAPQTPVTNVVDPSTTSTTTAAATPKSKAKDDSPSHAPHTTTIPAATSSTPVAREDPSTLSLEQFLGNPASGAKYIKRDAIGKGAFGEAYIVERPSDGKRYVAKLMDLHQMSAKDKRYAQTEILCLAHAQHFAIIQYVEHVVVDEDSIVIVMEFADHGDLYNNIRKNNLQLVEREAGLYFVQLLLALDHIHRRRMIHRDIKSANVFMTSQALLKLGDFGFSQQYDQTVSNPIATTFLGTPYYLAPEMWRGNRYGKKADMWAAGIVLFELLTSKRPFIAQNMPTLKEKVLNGSFQCPDSVSKEMQELVKAILVQDPTKRPSAQQALRLPIMQHYMVLLSKHVAECAEIDEETKNLVHRNIADSQEAIRMAVAEEEAQGQTVHHEGVVFKESDGGWKERFLILADGYLTMTLARGKEAAPGGDRSKKIPLDSLLSAVPVGSQPTGGNKWVFAISTSTSSAILMAAPSSAERDEWVTKLLQALEMN